MEIKRAYYLKQLEIRENNGLVKVITGVRRCGKSYLVFKLFKNRLLERNIPEDHIIEVILDSIEYEELREPHTLYSFIKSKIVDNSKYYILLDEVQFVERFSEVLNSLLKIDNVEIYATGSNSKFLSSDILTEFRGRGDEIRVYPLSFSEYCSAFSGSVDDAWNEYMTFGGLPRILSMQTDELKSKYLQDLFRETYLKDIVDRHNIRNRDDLDDLVNVLASAVGSLTNPTKLQNTFKSKKRSSISNKTIKTYIEYLSDAFLIDSALRYDIKGKRYINTPVKYYFVDTGLRNARLGFRQIEETHLMENVIFNELRMRGFSVDVGIIEQRRLDENRRQQRVQLEVDFIAYKGSNKYYIQSALAIPDAEKSLQEKRPLLSIRDSFKKIVVVGARIKPRIDDNGIVMMGVTDFLLNQDGLL